MAAKRLIEEKLVEQIEEERLVIPKEKFRKKQLDIKWLIIVSILVSLALTLLRIIFLFS